MKLYYRPGACALAPHILLEEVGAAFEAVEAERSAEFRKINKSGAVPVLITPRERTLTQCGAILQFISETAGREDLLGGDDTIDRAIVAMWSSFFTGDFHPAFYPIFVPQRYTTGSTPGDLQKTKSASISLIRSGLDHIEAGLAKSKYLSGDTLTVSDFFAIPMLRWCSGIFDDGLSEWQNTFEFYNVLTARPSTVRAMKTQGVKP